MSKEILGVSGTNLKLETRQILKPFRKPAIAVASLIAIGSATVGCEKPVNQTPDYNNSEHPRETIATQIPTLEAQSWILVPTNTPAPTHATKPPESPTPAIVPTKKPESTPTPTPRPTHVPPTPTLEPTPSPTPTFKLPGENVTRTVPVTNIHDRNVKRMFDVVFEGGDERNIKTELRLSNEPQKIYQDGSEISLPQGTNTLMAIMTVLSGARPTCFDKITLLEYSRETGWTNIPINKTILSENICIPDSIQVFFSYHKLQGREVFSEITFLNTGSIEQEVTFSVPQDKCYKAGQRDFMRDNKRISEQRIKIPALANGGVAKLRMYTILSFDENRTPLPDCSIEFNPILKN